MDEELIPVANKIIFDLLDGGHVYATARVPPHNITFRTTAAPLIAGAIKDVVLEDRCARPVLPGEPLSDRDIKEVKARQKLLVEMLRNRDDARTYAIEDAIYKLASAVPHLLAHIDYLTALLHDAQQESGYQIGYDRGRGAGIERAKEIVADVLQRYNQSSISHMIRDKLNGLINKEEESAVP